MLSGNNVGVSDWWLWFNIKLVILSFIGNGLVFSEEWLRLHVNWLWFSVCEESGYVLVFFFLR